MPARLLLLAFLVMGFIPPPPPPPPAAPPPAAPPPLYVPGIQVLPPTTPLVTTGIVASFTICPVPACFGDEARKPDNDEACKRLAEADRKVVKSAKTVAADAADSAARRRAAARKCAAEEAHGAATPGCDAWRKALERRANTCNALDARGKEDPPKPAADAQGNVLPVLSVASGEQTVARGQKLDLTGTVAFDKDVTVRVNGDKVALTAVPGSASTSRGFTVSVPTAQAGTVLYAIEACDSTRHCVGRDVVVRVQK